MLHYGHDGSTQVQSPAIGNALRQALSLDAAGSMGMDAGLTVHPVAIVADVRAQLGTGIRSYSGWRNVAAVAGQYSQVSLGITNIPPRGFKYAIPREVVLFSPVLCGVYWRLGINTPPATADAVTRELNTDVSAPGALAVVGGANAVAPVTATMNGLIFLPAGIAQRFEFTPEMRITWGGATTPGIVFHHDPVNVNLVASFTWDEYYQ